MSSVGRRNVVVMWEVDLVFIHLSYFYFIWIQIDITNVDADTLFFF